MLKRKYRLKQRRAFQHTYRRGVRVNCRGFSLNCAVTKLEHNRLGVVVSTKVSKKATTRNRIRRRLHGLMDEVWSELTVGHDIVITAREDISNWPGDKLRANLQTCLKKLGLLR